MNGFRPILTELLFIAIDPAHGPYEPLIVYILLHSEGPVTNRTPDVPGRGSIRKSQAAGRVPTVTLLTRTRTNMARHRRYHNLLRRLVPKIVDPQTP